MRVEDLIAHQQRAYESTRDPIYVWDGYRICRAGRLELPDWILNYFDAVANDLAGEEASTQTFARALAQGFETRGRRKIDWKVERDWRLAMLAQEEIEHGNSQVVAWEIVAAARGVSPETVRNAWRAYRRLIGDRQTALEAP
jgi:hypothetical protein